MIDGCGGSRALRGSCVFRVLASWFVDQPRMEPDSMAADSVQFLSRSHSVSGALKMSPPESTVFGPGQCSRWIAPQLTIRAVVPSRSDVLALC